jgi:hypothetical protein
MIEPNTEARRPGRPRREEATRTERRRRKGSGIAPKLEIPAAVIKAHPDMEFRYGRDDEGRIQQLTQNDDWDIVPDVAPLHAGTSRAGQPMKTHLLMKPKRFMDEDRAEKMARIDDTVNAQLTRPEAAQAAEQGADMYAVPGNKL